MWEKFKETASAHPYFVGGSVLVIVILIWWYSSSSTAAPATSGVYAQTQDPNVVAANAAQAISQNQTNAGVDVNGQNVQGTVQLATLSAQNNAALATISASAATTINQQNVTGAVTVAGLQLGAVQATDSAQLSAVRSTNTAQTTQTGILAALQRTLGLGTLQLQENTLADATGLAAGQAGATGTQAQQTWQAQLYGTGLFANPPAA